MADEDGLRLALTKLLQQRLRHFFDEALHLLRIARPGVIHRQIPARKLGRLRLLNGLRRQRLDQIIIMTKPGACLRPEPLQNGISDSLENFRDAHQPGTG